MQTTLFPKGVIQELEKHSRSFLWRDDSEGRKIHLASWDLITREKNGGMGQKKLRQQNEAFLMKLCWNLLTNKEALWVQVLRSMDAMARRWKTSKKERINSDLERDQ